MGLTCPVQSVALRKVKNINDVRSSIEGSAIQLFLSSARFRLSFASPIAERSTDQLTLPAVPASFLISTIYASRAPHED